MITIIIPYYENYKDLIECLSSFYKYHKNIKFEVLVINNSLDLQITTNLLIYKNLKVLTPKKNLGYGGGINFGSKFAKGKYLFILNQDVVFNENILEILIKQIQVSETTSIVAPLLIDKKNKVMDQGAKEITFIRALVKFSFLDKFFPNNYISKNYWTKKWNKNLLTEVDNVPGSAFLIKKNIFDKIGGFDDKFFLYFEEFDLCKRLRDKGYKIYIDSSVKLMHKWGTSTIKVDNINKIFAKSRLYYFKKYFGFIRAYLLESFLRIDKKIIFFIIIFILGAVVRLYKLESLVPFMGDQGWFYISARDMLVDRSIPLVGITSSHLWLHQGPLWTYVVGLCFLLFNFNPFSPFYLSIALDLITILLIFKYFKEIFNDKTAIIASLIYAFSPFVILSSRMAYHTSPIPLFVLTLFYSIYKWIKGDIRYFPLVIFSIFILYNLELQSSVYLFLFISILIFGYIKKTSWFIKIFNRKILFLTLLSFLIPMTPVLIYDFNNGFPQTLIFIGWVFYKFYSFIFSNHIADGSILNSYYILGDYVINFISKFIFLQNYIIALIVFASSVIFMIITNLKLIISKSNILKYLLPLLMFMVVFGGILITKTPSDAYLMSVFIPLTLIISLFLNYLSKTKAVFAAVLIILVLIQTLNLFTLVSSNYYNETKAKFSTSIEGRINLAKFLIADSGNKSFMILGKGEGSEFKSFTDNYKFLTWYLGKEFTATNPEIIYIVSEKNGIVSIIKKDIK